MSWHLQCLFPQHRASTFDDIRVVLFLVTWYSFKVHLLRGNLISRRWRFTMYLSHDNAVVFHGLCSEVPNSFASAQGAASLGSSPLSVGLHLHPSALLSIYVQSIYPAASWYTEACQSQVCLYLTVTQALVKRPLPCRRCCYMWGVWRIACQMCLEAPGLCKPVSQVNYHRSEIYTQTCTHTLTQLKCRNVHAHRLHTHTPAH